MLLPTQGLYGWAQLKNGGSGVHWVAGYGGSGMVSHLFHVTCINIAQNVNQKADEKAAERDRLMSMVGVQFKCQKAK